MEGIAAGSAVPLEVERPAWHQFDLAPSRRFFGVFGAIYDKIENKYDARAVIDSLIFAFGVISFAGWLFSIGKGSFKRVLNCEFLPIYYSNLLIVTNAVLVLFLTTVFLIKMRDRRRIINADRHRHFKILHRISITHVIEKEKINYYYRYIVKANCDGLTYFPVKFSWTGVPEKFELICRNQKFSVKDSNDSDQGGEEKFVYFGRALNKGDEEVIEICLLTVAKAGKEAKPFHGLTVTSPKFPLFNTHICVIFSEAVAVAALYKRTYFSAVSSRPIKNKVVSLKNRCYCWPIPVRAGWKYSLRWEYGV